MEHPVPTTDDVMSLLLRIPASTDSTSGEALALHVAAYAQHGADYVRSLIRHQAREKANACAEAHKESIEVHRLRGEVRDLKQEWAAIMERNAQDRRVEQQRRRRRRRQ